MQAGRAERVAFRRFAFHVGAAVEAVRSRHGCCHVSHFLALFIVFICINLSEGGEERERESKRAREREGERSF